MLKTVTTIFVLLFLLTASACGTINTPQSKPEPTTPPSPSTNQSPSQPDWNRQLHNSLNQFDGYELLDDIAQNSPDALTRVLADLKLVHTRIHSREAFTKYGYHSVTTPAKMAVVFETIYNEAYLGKEFSSILKEELSKTIFKEEIPRFMQNIKVLHKVGELPEVLCDVRIIDDGRDQILISSYTSTRRPTPYASNFIANISAKAYNLLRTK